MYKLEVYTKFTKKWSSNYHELSSESETTRPVVKLIDLNFIRSQNALYLVWSSNNYFYDKWDQRVPVFPAKSQSTLPTHQALATYQQRKLSVSH